MICQRSGGVNASGLLTRDDMMAIQQDYRSYVARDLVAAIQTVPANALTPGAKAVRDALVDWDWTASVGSTQQTLAMRVLVKLFTLASAETGEDYWQNPIFALNAVTRGDPACAALNPNDPTCTAFVVGALEAASTDDGAPSSWGSSQGRHVALFQHQILHSTPLACAADRQISHGGDFSTVNVGGFDVSTPAFVQDHGPSYRQIVDMSDPNLSIFLNPLGQSGNLLSDHYDDLLDDWADGGYLSMSLGYTVGVDMHQILQSVPPT